MPEVPSGNASPSTALVTGASSGIGWAIAERLREREFDVIAIGRDAESLARLQASCGARPLVADVRSTSLLRERLSGETIDLVVHCAALLTSRRLFHEVSFEDIDLMVSVNLVAPLQLTRLLVPAMIARGRGHLLFIGSSAGRWPHPNAAVYGASKAGLSLFCDALRCDLLGTGVRVTEIVAGRVETRLYRTALDVSAQRQLYDGYASMQPRDIAEMVVFATGMPAHVDVSRLEVFPTDQAVGGSNILKSQGNRA